MPAYYFITSKLNGNVLDIQGSNVTTGTPIISYPIDSPAAFMKVHPCTPDETVSQVSDAYTRQSLTAPQH